MSTTQTPPLTTDLKKHWIQIDDVWYQITDVMEDEEFGTVAVAEADASSPSFPAECPPSIVLGTTETAVTKMKSTEVEGVDPPAMLWDSSVQEYGGIRRGRRLSLRERLGKRRRSRRQPPPPSESRI